MLSDLLFTLLGMVLSLLVPALLVYYQSRNSRKLYGKWKVVFQPVYYDDAKWHVQDVTLKFSFFGIRLLAGGNDQEPHQTLHWMALLTLTDQYFLTGKWCSARAGSKSQGIISLQFSANGTFLVGHIYGIPSSNIKAMFGCFLMAKDCDGLEGARQSYMANQRGVRPSKVDNSSGCDSHSDNASS